MMIIRQTRDIPTNNSLWDYLTKENIEYTSHTYYKTVLTVYKIYTDIDNQLEKIDEILGGKTND